MNTKNPIRKHANWYGRNLVEISEEPAGRAIAHTGKLFAKLTLASVAVSAVVYGAIYVGYKVKDKLDERKSKN